MTILLLFYYFYYSLYTHSPRPAYVSGLLIDSYSRDFLKYFYSVVFFRFGQINSAIKFACE